MRGITFRCGIGLFRDKNRALVKACRGLGVEVAGQRGAQTEEIFHDEQFN